MPEPSGRSVESLQLFLHTSLVAPALGNLARGIVGHRFTKALAGRGLLAHARVLSNSFAPSVAGHLKRLPTRFGSSFDLGRADVRWTGLLNL
jgi:hypothetical protein